MILAIDPGPAKSGFVRFHSGRVLESDVVPNDKILALVRIWSAHTLYSLAIEKIEAMGMAVGADVFETVYWSGRFAQTWRAPDDVLRITRRQVKLGLCGSMRAKDPNIRQALIDKLGPPGTKKAPGPTHGVHSHAWSALAVAVIDSSQMGLEVSHA